MKNLNELGVQEMDALEMKHVDGGAIPVAILGIYFGVGVAIGWFSIRKKNR
ncbi:class IIb bacteriocin, lactobin A/cerein 7B family [Carboxylicivirga taeanensis]|uniref:class IIb bacteriocin, lactobin A/cerein 7B family n=1 Tax=Carboxylicivirga taeanensis TaxID=1416875 RepID=UPI003F6E37EE